MQTRALTLFTILFSVLLTACDSTGSSEEPPPIDLGDSSTIIMEEDSQYLQDVVEDMKIEERAVTVAEKKSEKERSTPDTVAKDEPEPKDKTAMMNGSGLKAEFPQVKMFIPGIDTRTYQKQNLETAFGASYELTTGEIRGNKLILEGHKIITVYQRYQSIIVARNDLGMLPIEGLKHLSDWEKIDGDNGVYTISLPEDSKLDRDKASNRTIRNAVSKAARDRNWTRNGRRQWERAVNNVKSTNQKPLGPELRAVMWKVVGEDENGRPYQRQLRIDIQIKS